MTESHVRGIWKSALYARDHAWQRQRLLEEIPALRAAGGDRSSFLFRYIEGIPHRFFSREAFVGFFEYLSEMQSSSGAGMATYWRERRAEMDHALTTLEEINLLPWHDGIADSKDLERIRFLDRAIHPTYLRLVEGPFHRLMHLPAFLSRKERGKGTDGLDIYNVVEEIQRTSLAAITRAYQHTVRNAIAHGGVHYRDQGIEYHDRDGKTEKLSSAEVISLFDDLLDASNGAALALRVFLLVHNELYDLPQSILFQELAAETETAWWKVLACIPSTIPPGRSQLIVYAEPASGDRLKIHYSCFQTAVLAELLAPGYNRYFISMRGRDDRIGWAAFDGRKIRETREHGPRGIEDYGGAAEIIYFVPRRAIPRFIGRMETFRIAATLGWRQFRRERAASQLETIARHASIHRNGWGAVVSGSVVVRNPGGPIERRHICDARRRIVRDAVRLARSSAARGNSGRYLPVGFARIAVFRADYRRRRLTSFGLGVDLIATIQIQRIRRIKSPDIFDSEVERCGGYRIAWNRAWLEEVASSGRAESIVPS